MQNHRNRICHRYEEKRCLSLCLWEVGMQSVQCCCEGKKILTWAWLDLCDPVETTQSGRQMTMVGPVLKNLPSWLKLHMQVWLCKRERESVYMSVCMCVGIACMHFHTEGRHTKHMQSSLSDKERQQPMIASALFLVSMPVVSRLVWNPGPENCKALHSSGAFSGEGWAREMPAGHNAEEEEEKRGEQNVEVLAWGQWSGKPWIGKHPKSISSTRSSKLHRN